MPTQQARMCVDLRQFGCEPCYRSWWKTVCLWKPVSHCKIGRVKYGTLLRGKEYGWGCRVDPSFTQSACVRKGNKQQGSVWAAICSGKRVRVKTSGLSSSCHIVAVVRY